MIAMQMSRGDPEQVAISRGFVLTGPFAMGTLGREVLRSVGRSIGTPTAPMLPELLQSARHVFQTYQVGTDEELLEAINAFDVVLANDGPPSGTRDSECNEYCRDKAFEAETAQSWHDSFLDMRGEKFPSGRTWPAVFGAPRFRPNWLMFKVFDVFRRLAAYSRCMQACQARANADSEGIRTQRPW